MLTIFRRHSRTCPHTSRTYRRCSCHIHVEGSLGGELVRKALDLTSWTAAVKLVRKWEEAGRIGAESQVVQGIETAVAKYLDGKRNKKLAESTIYKLRNIFEKQLLGWTKGKGYRHLRELTPERLSDWQTTWKDAPLAASKKYQWVVGFFYFCIRMKWIDENPMKAIDAPKVKQSPTLPFEAAEVNAIVSACDRFSVKGIYGEGNRARLRAMVLLLRYPGLRIRDAATLRRERLRDGKLLLYMQKTGVPIDQVSVLLGHSSVKITEKSYAPWVKARQEQLEAAVMKAWPTRPTLSLLVAS